MLPVIFDYICPSRFRGDDFYKSTNQKQELHIAMMFLNELGRNKQMSNRSREPFIDASYKVLIYLDKRF